ncbi:hypothetical protein RB4746 [Rhodopirellula baltica SH 1]|uniref:Uncharacterized protein n=1 Tax=Rhodopirellula baltica (strain DSM 10527 / NCIMB 13988 / SH1) TaxID=243090 RepID=Q7US25_RHOBA|nr:hypothetical protein RB4746 [Rhodopirellula baltica SH 1]
MRLRNDWIIQQSEDRGFESESWSPRSHLDRAHPRTCARRHVSCGGNTTIREYFALASRVR